MTPETIVKMSDEDNPTFVTLVNRWVANDAHPNPVHDARLLEEIRKKSISSYGNAVFGFLIASAATTFIIATLFPKLVAVGVPVIKSWPSYIGFFVGIAAAGIIRLMSMSTCRRVRRSCHDIDNVEAFCKAVERIEAILTSEVISELTYGPLHPDPILWRAQDALERAQQLAINEMKAEASRITHMQTISYRRIQAGVMHNELMKKWRDLSCLLDISKSECRLFPPTTAEEAELTCASATS